MYKAFEIECLRLSSKSPYFLKVAKWNSAVLGYSLWVEETIAEIFSPGKTLRIPLSFIKEPIIPCLVTSAISLELSAEVSGIYLDSVLRYVA